MASGRHEQMLSLEIFAKKLRYPTGAEAKSINNSESVPEYISRPELCFRISLWGKKGKQICSRFVAVSSRQFITRSDGHILDNAAQSGHGHGAVAHLSIIITGMFSFLHKVTIEWGDRVHHHSELTKPQHRRQTFFFFYVSASL